MELGDAHAKKWPTVRRAMENAAKGPKGKHHFLLRNRFPLVTPSDVDYVVSQRLRNWLNHRSGRRGERLGVVLVDFANPRKIEQLAARNFGRNSF